MRLQILLLSAILTLAIKPAPIQAKPLQTLPTSTTPTPDEAAVRAVIARETEGWAKFDPKQVVSNYTSDCVWQNPFCVRMHGTAELEKFLTNLMARPGYRAGKDTAPAKILDIRFTSPTTATVWSDEKSKAWLTISAATPCSPAIPTT